MGDDGLAMEKLRQFQFPILAMYGDKSQAKMTGKELLDVWPHAQFRRIRDAGHFFPTTKPEEVIATCHRFWDGEFEKERALRAKESAGNHFRSDRVFRTQGAWYFATRELTQVGPFARVDEAREHLAAFVSKLAAR
jgi:hypothetical protein